MQFRMYPWFFAVKVALSGSFARKRNWLHSTRLAHISSLVLRVTLCILIELRYDEVWSEIALCGFWIGL